MASSVNRLTELSRTGVALGIVDTYQYEQRTFQLGPGDFVLLYTDGITEVIDPGGEQFGAERLTRILEGTHNLGATDIVAIVRASLHDFTGGAPQSDDITMVVLRCV